MSAKDRDTGAEQRITITESANLDSSEVDRMVKDADAHRDEDARLRETIDARNGLDAAMHAVQRRLDELGSAVPVHEKARAERLVGDAKQALDQQEPLERLRTLSGELQQVAQSLSAAASTGAGPSGGPTGPEAATNEPGADDDVIDADFSEG